MLSHFFGHGDPREVLPLFLEEATISVQRAKSIGIIRGTVSPRELRAAIRKIIRTAE
jgi:enoyl-CoA hydratase/carnithine racemase